MNELSSSSLKVINPTPQHISINKHTFKLEEKKKFVYEQLSSTKDLEKGEKKRKNLRPETTPY